MLGEEVKETKLEMVRTVDSLFISAGYLYFKGPSAGMEREVVGANV